MGDRNSESPEDGEAADAMHKAQPVPVLTCFPFLMAVAPPFEDPFSASLSLESALLLHPWRIPQEGNPSASEIVYRLANGI